MKKIPEWEKIFANHTPDKELTFKIYNKHTIQKLRMIMIIIIFKLKWAKDLKRHVSKEDIQKANRYIKKMLSITSHKGNTN